MRLIDNNPPRTPRFVLLATKPEGKETKTYVLSERFEHLQDAERAAAHALMNTSAIRIEIVESISMFKSAKTVVRLTGSPV